MIAKNQIFNWVLDAWLWFGFLLAFFLNVTGLDLHQWLGVFLGTGVLFHLIVHFGWVKTVTTRFFGKTSWRMRLYYLLDASILWGFITILLTGGVISSWLSLVLSNYSVWRDVHVWSSALTLLAVVLKLGLHWKWIVSTLAKALTPPAPAPRLIPAPIMQPVHTGRRVTRREFMVMMAAVGAGAALGLGNVFGGKNEVEAQATNQTASTGSTSLSSGEIVSDVVTVPTAAAVTLPTVAPSSSTAALVCSQHCPRGKHCSFPGNCGRYTDSNNNGRCDLGECS